MLNQNQFALENWSKLSTMDRLDIAILAYTNGFEAEVDVQETSYYGRPMVCLFFSSGEFLLSFTACKATGFGTSYGELGETWEAYFRVSGTAKKEAFKKLAKDVGIEEEEIETIDSDGILVVSKEKASKLVKHLPSFSLN